MPRKNHTKFNSTIFSSFIGEDFLKIVNDVDYDDDGRRRSPSDGYNGSHGVRPGELKNVDFLSRNPICLIFT